MRLFGSTAVRFLPPPLESFFQSCGQGLPKLAVPNIPTSPQAFPFLVQFLASRFTGQFQYSPLNIRLVASRVAQLQSQTPHHSSSLQPVWRTSAQIHGVAAPGICLEAVLSQLNQL